MTVETTKNKSGPYVLDGVRLRFPRTFKMTDESHLRVIRVVDGVETDITGGYTQTGIGANVGEVVFTAGTVPTSGDLLLLRSVPLTQETDYANQARVQPEQIEADLDKQEMQIQDLQEQIDRTIRAAPGVGDIPEMAGLHPGRVLMVNEDGTQIVSGPNASEIQGANAAATAAQGSATAAAISAVEAAAAAAAAAGVIPFAGMFERLVARMMAGEAVRITAYGDSTTDGNGTTDWTPNPTDGSGNAIGTGPHTPPNAWPQICQRNLRSMFSNNSIVVNNAGYSGKQLQTGWATNNFQAAVLGPYAAPHAVIVSFGINDVRQPTFTLAAFEEQLLLLCSEIAKIGAFPIFQLPDEPSDERHNGWLLGMVRGVYLSVSERMGVEVIDWGTAMNELSQCSDGTGWRWGADQPDDTHGNDSLHSVKGGYIAACIYPHTLFVTQPITDIAPWSRYCKPIDGYTVYQGTTNKFGAAMVVPAGGYDLDQYLLDMWVWSVGAARQMYWAAVDANGYYYPRDLSTAPRIAMVDPAKRLTSLMVALGSGAASPGASGRDAEAMGATYRVPNGLSRWAFRAPRDVNTSDVYLGYFSIREVVAVYGSAVPLFGTVASPTIIDKDSESDIPQVFGIQNGRSTNLALTVDLQPGLGVCLWSSRVYGGTATRENNRKHGLFLFRHANNDGLYLYKVIFNADGSIGSSVALGNSPALTWSGPRQLRIVGNVTEGGGQTIDIYDGWGAGAAIISAANALSNAPWPWGGTPGAVWQHTGMTGVAGLTIYGDV